jgi:hypothetical protein
LGKEKRRVGDEGMLMKREEREEENGKEKGGEARE